MHVLHIFWWFNINTTAFCLGQFSLHLLLPKSSMADVINKYLSIVLQLYFEIKTFWWVKLVIFVFTIIVVIIVFVIGEPNIQMGKLQIELALRNAWTGWWCRWTNGSPWTCASNRSWWSRLPNDTFQLRVHQGKTEAGIHRGQLQVWKRSVFCLLIINH